MTPLSFPGRGVLWKMKEDLSAPIPDTASELWMRSMATCPTGS